MILHNLDLFGAMTADDHKFFIDLGKRIALPGIEMLDTVLARAIR